MTVEPEPGALEQPAPGTRGQPPPAIAQAFAQAFAQATAQTAAEVVAEVAEVVAEVAEVVAEVAEVVAEDVEVVAEDAEVVAEDAEVVAEDAAEVVAANGGPDEPHPLPDAVPGATGLPRPGRPEPGSPLPNAATHPRSRTTASRLADLQQRLDRASHAGTAAAVDKQHSRGKLTARERLDLLLDAGSFLEFDELARRRSDHRGAGPEGPPGDGVVTGLGTVGGRQVAVFAHDFTVLGGSLGEVFGEKIIKVMDLAMKIGCPIVGINDSGGARIQEGVVSLALYGEIFRRNVLASGVVPQISLILGPCAGGAVYSPAITDFTIMVEGTSHMFITGPDVIAAVTGERVGFEELGGARTHSEVSGNAHFRARDETEAIGFARALLSYLPSNNREVPPMHRSAAQVTSGDDPAAQVTPRGDPAAQGADPAAQVTQRDLALDALVPDGARQPYDMRVAVTAVLDDGELLEIQPRYAPNILVGFGRVEGRSVGVVANQPMRLAGALDIASAEKAARFVRTCDAFNIPVLTFVDVPGFLPGTKQEWGGIIRRGAKLIYAYAEATVPRVTVIARKAYGGAYLVMGSKHLGADVVFAWPTAELAVMGAAGAVNVLYRREIAAAADPDAERRRLIERYEQSMLNPYEGAERGYVDAVIAPSQTRHVVSRALQALTRGYQPSGERGHGNIPL